MLDFTCFNIKIKDLLVDSTLKKNFKKLWKILLNLKSTFFDSKLPLVIDEGSNIKSKITPEGKKVFIFTKGGSGSNSTEPSNNNNLNHRRPHRSAEEIKVARAAKKAGMLQKAGESDEKFNSRVIRAERKEYTRLRSKLNVNDSSGDKPKPKVLRSAKELQEARNEAATFMRRREGETDEQFNKRVVTREVNVWKRSGDKDSVDYAPKYRNPWVIANSVDHLRKSYPRLPLESMAEWTDRLSKIEKREYQRLINPNSTPRGSKEELPYQVIIDELLRNVKKEEGESENAFKSRINRMAYDRRY